MGLQDDIGILAGCHKLSNLIRLEIIELEKNEIKLHN